MLVACLGIGMARYAGVLRIVRRIRMAILTLIPFALMRSAVNRKILTVMIKGCRHPGCFTVTTGAIRREVSPGMAGVGGLIVVVQVTPGAGIRGIGVIAHMAGRTVVGYCGMRAVQRVITVVDAKCCRGPARRRVAGGAIGGDAQAHVIRIGALAVIRRVAGGTVGRRSGKPRSVAIDTGGG